MLTATKRLVAYLVAVVVLIAPKACAAVDDQSDDGSKIITLAGTGEHVFKPGDPNYGTYKAKATGKTRGSVKAKCRWRVYVPIPTPSDPNKVVQTDPKGVNKWHHLNGLYKGSVKIKAVTDPKYIRQPRILETENCPKWVMRK